MATSTIEIAWLCSVLFVLLCFVWFVLLCFVCFLVVVVAVVVVVFFCLMSAFYPSRFSSQLGFFSAFSKHVGLTTLHVGLAMIHAWFGSVCFALFAVLLLSSFDVGILFFGNGGEQVNSEEKLKEGGHIEQQT